MYDGDGSSGTRHHPRASPRGISAQSPNPPTTAAPARAPREAPPGRPREEHDSGQCDGVNDGPHDELLCRHEPPPPNSGLVWPTSHPQTPRGSQPSGRLPGGAGGACGVGVSRLWGSAPAAGARRRVRRRRALAAASASSRRYVSRCSGCAAILTSGRSERGLPLRSSEATVALRASVRRHRSGMVRSSFGRSDRSTLPNIQLHPPGPPPAPSAPPPAPSGPREFSISAPIGWGVRFGPSCTAVVIPQGSRQVLHSLPTP